MMKSGLHKYFLYLIIISLGAWLVSCAVNPVTGKRQLMLLSESDEIQLGKQTDEEVLRSYGIYADESLAQYISELGTRLARVSHRPNLNYQFRLLDSPVINAFAVPGGYVYITRGILAFLNSEAEFAGVMGHEIGHIAARHSAQQYTRAQLAQLGLGVASVVSSQFAKYADIAQLGVGLLFLKFSRDMERQADELGVEYATKIGYNARPMANFFATLKKMTAEEARGGLPGWFSTHPDPEEREAKIKQLTELWQRKVPQKRFVINRNEYLQRIDGIVYGEDPKQGYVADGYFFHPELRFQFPIPKGDWRVDNTPAQVQIFTPKKDAIIVFTLSTATTPREAAETFIAKSKASVLMSEPLRVHGFPAYRTVTIVNTENAKIQVLSYFIKKDKTVYVFHGYSTPVDFSRYEAIFQRTMSGFAKLDDPRRINVKPRRIRIKRMNRALSLEKLLTRWGVKKEMLKTVALLNGKELTDIIPANTYIKIIE